MGFPDLLQSISHLAPLLIHVGLFGFSADAGDRLAPLHVLPMSRLSRKTCTGRDSADA